MKLNIIESISTGVKVNSIFQSGINQCLVVSGNHKSFGECIESKVPGITAEFLDKYTSDSWESVLYYLVGIKQKGLSGTVRKLLAAAGLKEAMCVTWRRQWFLFFPLI